MSLRQNPHVWLRENRPNVKLLGWQQEYLELLAMGLDHEADSLIGRQPAASGRTFIKKIAAEYLGERDSKIPSELADALDVLLSTDSDEVLLLDNTEANRAVLLEAQGMISTGISNRLLVRRYVLARYVRQKLAME